MTAGYGFTFADNARTLVPGQYHTSIDAQVTMSNDSRCGESGIGGFEINQAAYDSAGALTTAAVRFDFLCSDGLSASGTIAYQMQNTTPSEGYYLYSQKGELTGFGNDNYLAYLGTPATLTLNAPIVDMVPTTDGNGYWMLSADGGVFAYGDAVFYGSMGGRTLNAPVVGMAATPDGGGYWLVAADGGIFAFGDAAFLGSRGGQPLNKPIVGMAADLVGGYWLVASDGGIFSYGGAPFFGSAGGLHLNKPVVGMAATPDERGYWLVAADGGIFAYGDAPFIGSTGGLTLAQPVVGMWSAPVGDGYWLVASDGGVFSYGTAVFSGSLGTTGASEIVGIAGFFPVLVVGSTFLQ